MPAVATKVVVKPQRPTARSEDIARSIGLNNHHEDKTTYRLLKALLIAAQLVGGEVSVPERHGQGAVAEDSP